MAGDVCRRPLPLSHSVRCFFRVERKERTFRLGPTRRELSSRWLRAIAPRRGEELRSLVDVLHSLGKAMSGGS